MPQQGIGIYFAFIRYVYFIADRYFKGKVNESINTGRYFKQFLEIYVNIVARIPRELNELKIRRNNLG